MPDAIGDIIVTAPLRNNAPPEELRSIVELLSRASYHYADDSSKEWGAAQRTKTEAAEKINGFNLGFRAIRALYDEKPQLLTLEDLIDSVLKDARK